MKYTKFDILKIKTKNQMLLWSNSYGIASNEVAHKLDIAMLNWQYELTESLDIWIKKGLSMTEGELILARVNLGAVVESWLKFFYCVYYEDYKKDPITNKKRKMVEPENAKFEDLQNFSKEKLWGDEESAKYIWVDSIRRKRNAIHSFKYKEIGTVNNFFDDMDYLYIFVDDIISSLPPIEDCIETYPVGYEMVPFEFLV